ncbi:alpha/beta hydrolase [Streptosporangium sp. NPDC000239]|uniref:alpha/beta hydrolase n=1 Tax=Streptosporangium sp. NPDC000239 TaxID=3154248 RepID=UPI003331B354
MKRVVGVAVGFAVFAAMAGLPQEAAAQERDDLVWGPCETPGKASSDADASSGSGEQAGAAVECASLRVPLDYADPDRTISLALNRVRGGDSRNHLGALLVNPGGPGASGLSLARRVAAQLPPDLAGRFDVIGFDPRGVGHSEPALRCVDPAEYYAPPRPDNVPGNAEQEAVLLGRARRYAEACQSRWDWMLPHLSTENSARDMDEIRKALGEEKISYLGYSYGTYLGAVYATLFPGRVSRMVMDSVVDPKGIWYGSNLAQDVAFNRRHRDFLRWTARHNDVYRLGRTTRMVSFAWYAMRNRLRVRPAGGVVGPSELDDIYTLGGYSDLVWPQLAKAFSTYVKKGDDAPLLAAYHRYAENDAEDENGYAVYLGVQCHDAAWPGQWSKWRADMSRTHAKAPFLTWSNAWYNAPCVFWPERGGTPVTLKDNAGLPPIMIVQAERDAATPYRGALRMRAVFGRSRMLAVAGGNHGATFSGNQCVDRRLAAYLRDGTLFGPARRAARGPDARCAATSQAPAAAG